MSTGKDLASWAGITLVKLLTVPVLGGGAWYLADRFGPGVAIGAIFAGALLASAWVVANRTRGARKTE